MTVTTSTARVVHNGNGTTIDFAVPFRFLENDHVAVFLRDAAGGQVQWVENTHYTLTGADAAEGGALKVITSPTDYTPIAGTRLVIVRAISITQETDYVENDPFPAETHERALDKLTMVNQEQTERLDRTFTVPEADNAVGSFILPPDTQRANMFLLFDGLGFPAVSAGTASIEPAISAFMETLLAAADGPSALTQLGGAVDVGLAKLAADNALTGDNTLSGGTTLNGPLVMGDGSELTIAAGAITPAANYHTVDTEADAASDDLTDIATANIPEGGVLLLRAANATRTVVVTHTASGAGKIVLDGGADYRMDDSEKSITLQRRGDHWEEVSRSFRNVRGELLHVRDEQPSGTQGGATTSGSWFARPLNSVVANEIAGSSFSTNQITLPAGTYDIEASSNFWTTNRVRTKLRNVTDSSDIIVSISLYTGGGNFGFSQVKGRVTISTEKIIEYQYRVESSKAGDGLGVPSNFPGEPEVFAEILIWRIK